MFDFNKLGDMTKMASQAKKLQAKQEEFQSKQLRELKEISVKLDKIIRLLEK
jgi:hypothetical protein